MLLTSIVLNQTLTCQGTDTPLRLIATVRGYMTAWIGKNHNTPTWEASAAGPFDRWANGLGFDYFYGFNAGDMNHLNLVLFEHRNLVPASTDPNDHLTADIADHAIAWVRKVKSISPDRPFLLHIASGATHSSDQAPWIGSASFRRTPSLRRDPRAAGLGLSQR
jgi:arylsulfatase A-like enzyme